MWAHKWHIQVKILWILIATKQAEFKITDVAKIVTTSSFLIHTSGDYIYTWTKMFCHFCMSPQWIKKIFFFFFFFAENWFLPEPVQGDRLLTYYCSSKYALFELWWCQPGTICPCCTTGWQNDTVCCGSEQGQK